MPGPRGGRVRRDFKVLVEESLRPVSIDAGTPYPCTEQQLHDLRYLLVVRYPQPWSTDRAANWLLAFLRSDARQFPKVNAAMLRLGVGVGLGEDWAAWGPDLIIKAFYDLDTAFFGSNLGGMTRVEWVPDSFFRARGHDDTFGLTVDQSRDESAQRIYLNAHVIWKAGRSGYFREMWGTLLHEMVVGIFVFVG
ncbi:MAG: hypothetical protein Q9169_007561 [Polycauliona sp. 2 TL-2023]